MPPVMFSVVTKYHKGRHSLFLYNSEIFYAFTQDILRSRKLTSDPNLAVLFAILSDTLAALPTYIKVWRFPYTERAIFYGGGAFSALTSLIAAPNNNFSTIGFAIYLVILNTSLMFLIYFRQKSENNLKINF